MKGRDYLLARQDEAALRQMQRRVVDALLRARPEAGFFSKEAKVPPGLAGTQEGGGGLNSDPWHPLVEQLPYLGPEEPWYPERVHTRSN